MKAETVVENQLGQGVRRRGGVLNLNSILRSRRGLLSQRREGSRQNNTSTSDGSVSKPLSLIRLIHFTLISFTVPGSVLGK